MLKPWTPCKLLQRLSRF